MISNDLKLKPYTQNYGISNQYYLKNVFNKVLIFFSTKVFMRKNL